MNFSTQAMISHLLRSESIRKLLRVSLQKVEKMIDASLTSVELEDDEHSMVMVIGTEDGQPYGFFCTTKKDGEKTVLNRGVQVQGIGVMTFSQIMESMASMSEEDVEHIQNTIEEDLKKADEQEG